MEDRNEFVSMLTSLPVAGKKICKMKSLCLHQSFCIKAPMSPFEFLSLTPNFEYKKVTLMNNLPYESILLLVKTSAFKGI